MSSYKLNDPLAPMYRRNYRTHLALEDSEYILASQSSSADSTAPYNGTFAPDDHAPLLISQTSTSVLSQSNLPVDHRNVVKYSLLLLGLVALLPWNFFITASQYWTWKLRDVNNSTNDPDHKTQLQSEFFSMLSIVSNVPFLVVLYLSAFINAHVPQRIRNIVALVTVTILFFSVTIFVVVDTDTWQRQFYELTLVQMFLVASFGAWYQGGIMGLASIFPHDYTHFCIIGQSAGGVLASLLQVFVLLLGVSPSASALLYFVFALIILITSIAVFLYIQRLNYFQFYLKQASDPATLSSDEGLFVKVRTSLLFRKTWKFCIGLVAIYVCTIGVFPGVLVHVKSVSTDKRVWNEIFSPVACFLVFNIGDLVGRLLCSTFGFPAKRENLFLALTVTRLLMVPLLFMCNIHPRVSYLPVIFDSDVWFIFLNAIFAVSNGYFTSVAMVYAPKKVDYFLQERVGTIMVAMLASGMSLGSVASLLFIKGFFPISD